MKPFWKTKDGVTDSLLRAYVSRPTNPRPARQECPDFDPDLANAYIERALTTASRSRYEEHLSECPVCRKNVVALVRLSGAGASGSISSAPDRARVPWLSGVTQIFGALSRPQWAMAATAVIVLAISLPLLLSRNNSRFYEKGSAAIAEPSADRASSVSQPAPAATAVDHKSGDAASPASAASPSRHPEKRGTETLAMNAPAPSQPPAETAAGSEQSQKLEAKSAPQTLDHLQQKSDSQAASQAGTRAQAPGETQVARNDSNRARQELQEKDSAQPTAPKPVAAAESANQEKERRAEAVAPPPAPSSPERGKAGKSIKQPGMRSLRDSRNNEAVRPNELSIRGKTFLFKGDAWTDKEFDPDKDLPVVTIIRDSNVYREVLAKQRGLRPYLTAFTGRAIIVYKGTVYKLIPQQSDK